MKTTILTTLAALLFAACAGDTAPGPDAGQPYVPVPFCPDASGPPRDDCRRAHPWDDAPEPQQPVTDASVDIDSGADDDAGIDYFGDSGWHCCYSNACNAAAEHICEAGEVPATDGETSGCVPDVGQCEDPDADAG